MPKAKTKQHRHKVEQTELSELKPYEKNPRINTDAVDRVAKSITDHGFTNPIITNKDGVILAGHTRYLAAKKLGLKKVPVLRLNVDNERAYRIADNRTGEFSTWDFDLLVDELVQIKEEGVEIELTGFDADELKRFTSIPELTSGEASLDDLPGVDLTGDGSKPTAKVLLIPVANQRQITHVAKKLGIPIKPYKEIKQTTTLNLWDAPDGK